MADTVAMGEHAQMVSRACCIACGSENLTVLDTGRFCGEPVRSFLEKDPWGVCPLAYLRDLSWEFVRCSKCSQMFHRHVLSPQWEAVYYGQWIRADSIRQFEHEHGLDTPAAQFGKAVQIIRHVLRLELLTRTIRAQQPLRVLDFGCGWGEFVRAADFFGFRACGVDAAPDRREVARGHGLAVFADLDEAAAHAGGAFHAVTLFQVLEHLSDPLGLLVAIAKRMASGGVLVVEVPDCEGIAGIKSRSDYENIHPLGHINAFTPSTLREIVVRAGFRPLRQPVAQVTVDSTKVIKGEIRRAINAFWRPSTNQYFQRA